MPGGASAKSWTTRHMPSTVRTMSTAYVVIQRAGCVDPTAASR
jgi:hypothetical protein